MLCADESPTRAVANVVGNINGQEFGVSTISANIHRVDGGSQLSANLTDTPLNISMTNIRRFEDVAYSRRCQ